MSLQLFDLFVQIFELYGHTLIFSFQILAKAAQRKRHHEIDHSRGDEDHNNGKAYGEAETQGCGKKQVQNNTENIYSAGNGA